jgi:hypothetical protein
MTYLSANVPVHIHELISRQVSSAWGPDKLVPAPREKRCYTERLIGRLLSDRRPTTPNRTHVLGKVRPQSLRRQFGNGNHSPLP